LGHKPDATAASPDNGLLMEVLNTPVMHTDKPTVRPCAHDVAWVQPISFPQQDRSHIHFQLEDRD